MKKLFPFILIFIGFSAFAQDYKVPDYKFEKDADYAQYNDEILKCINYLETTSPTQNVENRKAAVKFFIVWLTGTPDVGVELLPEVIKFDAENPDLITAFMTGWTKYALENPTDAENPVKLNTAALKSVINANKKAAVKDPEVDKLAKLDEQHKLEDWVSGQLKK
jgi:hypothetical protein